MTNRPGLNDIEQVINAALHSDEKLARQVKLYFRPRYSGKKLREIGERFGVSESGVTQASGRIRIRQKNDKKFGKPIAKMVRELALSNVKARPPFHSQELLGHSRLQTTMIYTHVAAKNRLGVTSPLD